MSTHPTLTRWLPFLGSKHYRSTSKEWEMMGKLGGQECSWRAQKSNCFLALSYIIIYRYILYTVNILLFYILEHSDDFISFQFIYCIYEYVYIISISTIRKLQNLWFQTGLSRQVDPTPLSKISPPLFCEKAPHRVRLRPLPCSRLRWRSAVQKWRIWFCGAARPATTLNVTALRNHSRSEATTGWLSEIGVPMGTHKIPWFLIIYPINGGIPWYSHFETKPHYIHQAPKMDDQGKTSMATGFYAIPREDVRIAGYDS